MKKKHGSAKSKQYTTSSMLSFKIVKISLKSFLVPQFEPPEKKSGKLACP